MSVQFGAHPSLTTTVIRKNIRTSIPQIRTISDQDLAKFVASGISVKIPTPFVKIGTEALFGVNIDGFIPAYNMTTPIGTPTPIYMNLFPVQTTKEGKRLKLKVVQEMVMIPAIHRYLSNRFMSGNIGLGVRLSSNTALTGNFYVTQASGVVRDYYTNRSTVPHAQKYDGLKFLNASHSGIDYAQDACTVLDVSLNRNLSITTMRRDVTQKTDLAMKFDFVSRTHLRETKADHRKYNVGASMFAEDWLLFTPVSDFAGIAANQITMTFFFDYSRVNFYAPLLPFIPFPPVSTPESRKDVLLFSDTFNDKYPELLLSYYQWGTPANYNALRNNKG